MKINQVEELVGITKKNIRFYEEQGLICPKRNSENGYRDYSLDDVKVLNQIKLLRRLEVPIEEIRKLQANQISLDACLEKQIAEYKRRQRDMDVLSQLCTEIIDSNDELEQLDAELARFNKNYSLAQVGLGRSTGSGAVRGLVVTFYTNTAKRGTCKF